MDIHLVIFHLLFPMNAFEYQKAMKGRRDIFFSCEEGKKFYLIPLSAL